LRATSGACARCCAGLAHGTEAAFAEADGHLARAERALGQALAALPAGPLLSEREGARELRDERLAVEPERGRAVYAGRALRLAAKEFALLVCLARDPARCFAKAELIAAVWGWNPRSGGRTRTVESHASRLRRALVAAGAGEGEWVINRWGEGYALRRSRQGSA
jgi:DNA-binding response OmpR family regulator